MEGQIDIIEKQVHIDIYCDEGFVADSLRQMANAIENGEVLTQFETFHCCAGILS